MRLWCCGFSAVEPELAPEDAEELERRRRIERCHACTRANDGRLIVQGVLQRANARNRNGRVYPKEILMREADSYYRSHVLKGLAFGELDHPDSQSPLFRSLDWHNVSHQVLDYWWEGDDLVGVVEVLPTAKGEELMEYFNSGRKLGVSSRGWATLEDSGDGTGIYIQDDFELITFDFVSDPSTEGAFLTPIPIRYKNLRPQANLSKFDTLIAHPLAPPPPVLAPSGANGQRKTGPVGAGRQSNGSRANGAAPTNGVRQQQHPSGMPGKENQVRR